MVLLTSKETKRASISIRVGVDSFLILYPTFEKQRRKLGTEGGYIHVRFPFSHRTQQVVIM